MENQKGKAAGGNPAAQSTKKSDPTTHRLYDQDSPVKPLVSVFAGPVSNVKDFKNMTWPELAELLQADPVKLPDSEAATKAQYGAYFTRGQIQEARNDENLQSCSLIILDVDKQLDQFTPLPTPKQIKKALKSVQFVAYNTATPGRSRIVLPVKPYPKDQTEELTKAAYLYCRERDLKFAYSGESRTKSQPWFLPQTTKPKKHQSVGQLKGQLFDPGMVQDQISRRKVQEPGPGTKQPLGNHLAAFIQDLGKGTIHQAAKTYAGWLKKTTNLSMSQLFDDITTLVEIHCKDQEKVMRWHKSERSKLEEWFKQLPQDPVLGFCLDQSTEILEVLKKGKKVKEESMKWRWKNWLPSKKLMIFAAEGGTGKSTVLYDLAARETAGLEFPFSNGKGSGGWVLYVTAEDDVSDTIIPRFKAAGGDPSRLLILTSDKIHLDLSEGGLNALQKILDKYPKISMVIIDPIDSYCGTKNTHMASTVKSIAGPINALARRNGVTVIGVLHFNKQDVRKTTLKNMVSGSASWINSARLAVVAFEDPENEMFKYMGVIKSNNGKKKTHIQFTVRLCDGVARIKYLRLEEKSIQQKADQVFNVDKKIKLQVEILKLMERIYKESAEVMTTTAIRTEILRQIPQANDTMIQETLKREYEKKNKGGEWFYLRRQK